MPFEYRSAKIVLSIFLVALSGCRVPDDLSTAPVILPDANPSRAATATPARRVVIPTVTLTPSPTIDLTPTMPIAEREDYLIDLLTVCDLPCWGGLHPGVSQIQSGYDVFAGTSIKKSVISASRGRIWHLLQIDFLSVEFGLADVRLFLTENELIENDQTIENIVIHITPQIQRETAFHALMVYSLSSILGEYGVPTDIFISVVPPLEPNSTAGYTLFLVYRQQGFTIEYSGSTDPGQTITICPKNLHFNQIYLTLYGADRIDEDYELMGWIKIEEATDISSIEDFYKKFLVSDSGCFSTETAFWRGLSD